MDLIILDCGAEIKGDSQRIGYQGKIECLSFNHGVHRSQQEFTVTKYIDGTTSSFIDYCNSARVIPTAKVKIISLDGGAVDEFLVYTLTNVVVTSISIGGGAGDMPTETVTLNYTKIQWDYKLQAANASKPIVKSKSWNLETGQAE